jgi:phosphatidyl-myo-inositol dimannoside synthase
VAHVRLLGAVDDQTLSDAYFGADVMVFPVLNLPGDVEGFGMVAIEAAAHGLPTVAFAIGGVPDAVADGESGWLVAPGDNGAFAKKVLALLDVPQRDEFAECCRHHAGRFEWSEFGQRLQMAVGDES